MRFLTLEKVIFLLICLATLTDCRREKIDNPGTKATDELSDFRNQDDEFCDLFFLGTVIDPDSRLGIPDAEVRIDFISIFTDDDGAFKLKVNAIQELMAEKKVIQVIKEGYEFSTFEILFEDYIDGEDCVNSKTTIEIDFVMTQENQTTTVDETGGAFTAVDTVSILGDIDMDGVLDTIRVVDSVQVDIPEGALANATDIAVVPLNPDTYLGSFADEESESSLTVKRFAFSPDGATFDPPLTLTFQPDFPVTEDDVLLYYTLNTATNPVSSTDTTSNEWELVEDAMISYNPSTGEIELEVSHFSFGLVKVNSAVTEVEVNEIVAGATIINEQITNCECGNLFTRDLASSYEPRIITSFTFNFPDQNDPAIPLYNTLLQSYLTTNFNLPSQQSGDYTSVDVMQSGNTIVTTYVLPAGQAEASVLIEKCDVEQVVVNTRERIIAGNIANNLVEFEISQFESLEVDVNNFACPTDTPCHQGCN